MSSGFAKSLGRLAVGFVCAIASLEALGQEPKLYSWGVVHGTHTVRVGRWTTLGVTVENAGPQATDPLVCVYFSGDKHLQYGRRVWVPAESRRSTFQLVQVPSDVTGERTGIHNLFFTSAGKEITRRSQPGQVIDDTPLPITQETPVTGFVTEVQEDPSDAAYEMTVAARVGAGLSRRLALLNDRFLPACVEALDPLDQVIVSGDRIALDAAATRALRDWIVRGGKACLLLDRMQIDTVEALLQGKWTCEEIDRVGLTSVQIVSADGVREAETEYEQPVDLVRIIPQDVTVTHTVNGWPAAFRKPFGRGEVLFLALGPRGWMRPRNNETDPPVQDLHRFTSFVELKPLHDLFARFLEESPAFPAPMAGAMHKAPSEQIGDNATGDRWQRMFGAMQQASSEQIGYRIPERGVVAGLLAIFCGVLAAAGVWFFRRRTLEHAAWLSPLAALAVGSLLVGLSVTRRSAIPATVVVSQIGTLASEQPRMPVQGVMSVYSPNGGPVTLGSKRGGVFVPAHRALEGTTRRMVWDDLEHWQWEKLSLPAGVTLAIPFTTTVPWTKPATVRGSFGPQGLSGVIDGEGLDDLQDAVVALPDPRVLTVTRQDSRRFQAGPEDVQSRGTFIVGTLLSDEQRRRQTVYQQFLEAYRLERASAPLLLGWLPTADPGFELPAGSAVSGATLVAVPIRVEPTPAGTRVTIPSPFLAYRPALSPTGEGQSSPFNHRTGEWQERAGPAKSWLRVQMPEPLHALQVGKLSVTVQVVGAARRIAFVGWTGKAAEDVLVVENPVGTVQVDLTKPAHLTVDKDGGLLFGVHVGREEEPRPEGTTAAGTTNWRIESLQVQVDGTAR